MYVCMYVRVCERMYVYDTIVCVAEVKKKCRVYEYYIILYDVI